MLYTIFYYRALGIVVVLGLVTTAASSTASSPSSAQSSLGLTLDLSGVTGLIVSVGITVDSYVVYFERLKDEVRARPLGPRRGGPGLQERLPHDPVRGRGVVHRCARAVVLSVGAVRGFAFMLGLSTLVDVVTAYIFTRPLVILLGRNRIFTEAPHLRRRPWAAPCRRRLPSDTRAADRPGRMLDAEVERASSGVYYGETRFDFVRSANGGSSLSRS